MSTVLEIHSYWLGQLKGVISIKRECGCLGSISSYPLPFNHVLDGIDSKCIKKKYDWFVSESEWFISRCIWKKKSVDGFFHRIPRDKYCYLFPWCFIEVRQCSNLIMCFDRKTRVMAVGNTSGSTIMYQNYLRKVEITSARLNLHICILAVKSNTVVYEFWTSATANLQHYDDVEHLNLHSYFLSSKEPAQNIF